jgi:hypothetical protein
MPSLLRPLVPVLAIAVAACDINLVAADGGPDGLSIVPPDGALVLSDAGGGPCLPDGSIIDQCPARGLVCCEGSCVNTANDPSNCGGCGTPCMGLAPMCHEGVCSPAACMPRCTSAETCCDLPTPTAGAPRCVLGGACPVACPPCG